MPALHTGSEPRCATSVSQRPVGALHRAWLGLEARALRRLSALAQRHSGQPAHLLTGLDGEREALFYLRSLGYIVVARRWRTPRLPGDLDLIAWHGEMLCFIEIKTRSTRNGIPAEASIDHDKRRTLQHLAQAYMRRLPTDRRDCPARFDVLSVYPDPQAASGLRFELLPGAFSWS